MEPLKESDLKPDKDAPAPPRVRFGEVGYLGLRATAKRVLEEANVNFASRIGYVKSRKCVKTRLLL